MLPRYALRESLGAPQKHLDELIAPWAKLPVREFLPVLAEVSSLADVPPERRDDMTMVVLEVDA